MAGMVTNPMAQLQSQNIQNQAIQSQLGMQNFLNSVMGAYGTIAASPTQQNAAINYLQGTPQGVGGIGGGLLANMNAAGQVVPGSLGMNPAIAGQVMGQLQPALNRMASGEYYANLGLPFGARLSGLGVPGSQQIQSQGIGALGAGLGYAMGQGGGSLGLPAGTGGASSLGTGYGFGGTYTGGNVSSPWSS